MTCAPGRFQTLGGVRVSLEVGLPMCYRVKVGSQSGNMRMQILASRRRLFPALLLLAFAAIAAKGQEKPLITILPFQAIEVSKSVATIISTLFETDLVNTRAYTVLSQNERDRILQAQEVSLQDCTDVTCAIEIGKLLSAEQIIIGTVGALGKKFIISAKIIDITTSTTLGADSVSAESIEALDVACQSLTRSLVSRALPSAALPEEGPKKPVEASKPAKTAQAKPKAQPVKEKVARAPGTFNGLALGLLGSGVLLLGAGGIASDFGFEAQRRADAAWADFTSAGVNDSTLLGNYDSNRTRSVGFGLSSYALWALGAGGLSASISLLPGEALSFSPLGRLCMAAGVITGVAGNYFALKAGMQSFRNGVLWSDYAGSGGSSTGYSEYEMGYKSYMAFRVLNYALWGVAGAGVAAAPFLPGEKRAAAATPLQKILLSAGLVMMAGGSYCGSMSLNALRDSEVRWSDYTGAGTNDSALFTAYEKAYGRYLTTSILSYGLWAGGGTAVLVGLLAPFGAIASAQETTPLSFGVLPAPGGFIAHLILRL